MGSIQTVCGPIDPTGIGPILVHEHILFDLRCLRVETSTQDPQDDLPVSFATLGRTRPRPYANADNLRSDDVNLAAAEIRNFAEAGGGLIVDVTSASIGRDHLKLRRLSEVTGVPIVMGCGHYVDASLSVETRNASIDALAREMIEDIRVGVSGSGVKAGVIGEIGASNPLTRAEENILRAAVFAQKETEAAIIVHSPSGIEGPLIMADFLEAAGADTSRVVLCHLDARFGGDTALYTALATRGFVLAMDTFGRDIYVEFLRKQHPNDTTRIETLVALCEAGLERQILVSQDICLKSEFYHFGGRGYAHILDTLVPRILRAGISTRTLENILIENPRRMLTLRKRVSRRKCGANW